MAKTDALWEFINKIWGTGQDRTTQIKEYESYWNGDLGADYIPEGSKQTKTAANIVKPIIEARTKAMLDSQYVPAVIPHIKVFSTWDKMKDAQDIADVFNAEITSILKNNNFDKLKEQIGRQGLISGAGAIQVLWNADKSVEGDIKLSVVDTKNLKWDAKATGIDDATFIGYSLTMNASVAKNKYCRNEDGTFDIKKCDKIDSISQSINPTDQDADNMSNSRSPRKLITYETPQTTGLAYLEPMKSDYAGIKYDQVVKLVVLFLLDDSLYSPKDTDDRKEKEEKTKGLRKYPNGRMIIFSTNNKYKMIFEDIPLDESFKNLGNIDFFYPMATSTIYGRGEVEDLYTIQDRINGLYNKFKIATSNAFSALVVDKDGDLGMSDLVTHPIIYVESLSVGIQPYVISNNGIEQAAQLMEMIEALKTYAYEQARINPTMLFGTRQTGTTSASQIEALEESPMTDIRQLQRNFKDFIINIGEKCLKLILENYKFTRLIKLTSDIDKATHAQIQYTENEQGEEQQVIKFLGKANETIREITVDKDWEFKVEVIAGTEIPRTRKESAKLLETLIEQGILPLDDLEVKEAYLKALDFPEARVWIDLLKNKQKEAQENPPQPTIEDLVGNPDVGRTFAEIFKALEGHPLAQGQILQKLGLNPETSTFATAAVDKTASKADAMDIAILAQNKISGNPEQNQEGKDIAIQKEMLDMVQ